MTTVRELHTKSMFYVDRMLATRASGQSSLAESYAIDAFEAELAAAQLAFDKGVSAATRVILLRSAANLAREARRWEAGIELAIRALYTLDLKEHRVEIFRIVDTLRTYEHLQLIGVQLSENDLQLSVSGLEAAPGFARADEVNRRVEHVRTLMIRGAMRRAGMPFNAAVPSSKRFRELFTPYLSQSRVASYAITLRFGVVDQIELDLESSEVAPAFSARDALDDLITAAKEYAKGGLAALRKVIADEEYAATTASLLRHLSPDDERVSTVGLTVFRDGQPDPIALPPRTTFDAPKSAKLPADIRRQALPPAEFDAIGQLLEGGAKKADRAWCTIVMDDGVELRARYDEATLGDVMGGYWKHQVRARLVRSGNKPLWLKDISDA